MELKRVVGSIMLVALMIISIMPSVTFYASSDAEVQAMLQTATIYSPSTYVNGIIEQDRHDYNASVGSGDADKANFIFQGPGLIYGSPSVGYMKDIYLNITNAGTLAYLNYTGEGIYGDRPLGATEYRWLPMFDPDSQATLEARGSSWTPGETVTWEPLEGWAIAYTIETGMYPWTPDDFGYLVVTYSGFDETNSLYDLQPNVIGFETVRVFVNGSWHWLPADNWDVRVVTVKNPVDNPRLSVYYYEILAKNTKSFDYQISDPANLVIDNIFEPEFLIKVYIIFNKATKFVEVWTSAQLVNISNVEGKDFAEFKFQLSRMAIFDANPACDWAYYGWKYVNISYNGTMDPTAFITLSYINETLTNTTARNGFWDSSYDHYAAYMLGYPVVNTSDNTTFTYAIASVLPHDYLLPTSPSPSPAWYVWKDPFLSISIPSIGSVFPVDPYVLSGYAHLVMNTTAFKDKLGDQALVRYEWFKQGVVSSTSSMTLKEVLMNAMTIKPKLVMYGVYDVNGTLYIGGEGGPYTYPGLLNPIVVLSNDTVYPPSQPHPTPGTLAYLNTHNLTDLVEESLFKMANGTLTEDGYVNGTLLAWSPTEELLWQLYWKFAPPSFSKIGYNEIDFNETKPPINGSIMWDFLVTGAPGRVTDALGAAWLNARFTAKLVLFDVDLWYGTGNLPPFRAKLSPYLMLEVTAPMPNENYAARKAHYLTPDGRAFLQMDIADNPDTPWRDTHYLVVTVAGPFPNLATYYFNDFVTIVYPMGGDAAGRIVILPTGGSVDTAPYSGLNSNLGLGVIALARDHFNNHALVVWGLTAHDTYWTAWYAYNNITTIVATHGPAQSLLILINYTSGASWSAGSYQPYQTPTSRQSTEYQLYQ